MDLGTFETTRLLNLVRRLTLLVECLTYGPQADIEARQPHRGYVKLPRRLTQGMPSGEVGGKCILSPRILRIGICLTTWAFICT